MSGTIGKQYLQLIEQRKKAMLARQRASELQLNREQAIKLVLKAFGWEKLEPWAETKINALFNGGTIDIKDFAEKLQNWKEQQLAGETTDGNNEVQEG